MAKKPIILFFILAAVLAACGAPATQESIAIVATRTDEQIFAQAEELGIKLGMPADSSETAPAIDPGGQITRTTECSWLYGRPKNNHQEALVVCEYQSRIVGKVYTAEDGVTTANWNLVITARNAPQVSSLLETMISNLDMSDFRNIALRELKGVRSMTFIASREKGIVSLAPDGS